MIRQEIPIKVGQRTTYCILCYTMAARTKKGKLPADLYEAEALLRTTSSARHAMMEAYKSLQAVELNEVEGVPEAKALSPDALTTWLVAKYGIQEVQKMAKILVNLPETLTASQKNRYFKQLSGRDSDSDLLCRTIEKSSICTNGGYDRDVSCVKILSPPVKQCTICTSNLIENHHCRVKLYTLAGMHEAEKVTLRCITCKTSYNYDKWGDKLGNGFKYYPVARTFVEVNDTTYFEQQLLDLQCSLGYVNTFNNCAFSGLGMQRHYADVTCGL